MAVDAAAAAVPTDRSISFVLHAPCVPRQLVQLNYISVHVLFSVYIGLLKRIILLHVLRNMFFLRQLSFAEIMAYTI